MKTETQIGPAVKGIREDLASGLTFAEAIARAAELYELHPALLERKFHEQYRLTPQQVASLGRESVETKQGQLRALIEETATRYGRHPMLGKKFTTGFKNYIFVSLDEGAEYPVVAVEVETQEVRLMALGYFELVQRSRL